MEIKTTSADLEVIERAVLELTAKLNSVKSYMISYGVHKFCIERLDEEVADVYRAYRHVIKDWEAAKAKKNKELNYLAKVWGTKNENKKRVCK